jgi:hypothetical protein
VDGSRQACGRELGAEGRGSEGKRERSEKES